MEEEWITDPELLEKIKDTLRIVEEYVKIVRAFRRKFFIITDTLEAAA